MNDKTETQIWYTVNVFAKKMDVHPNTVRRAIRSGKLFAFRFGTDKKGTYRIPHSEIEKVEKYGTIKT